MNSNRPINLDLASLKYPPMAIASILHRISGILLFLLLPFIMYCFDLSVRSPDSFILLQSYLRTPYWTFLLWVFTSALIYHVLAGIRHLFLDFGIGEQVSTARYTSTLVIILAFILSLSMGVWLW